MYVANWTVYCAMEHRVGHTKRLIITSADAPDISSVGGIRYPAAEPNDSLVT
jgi:hypothetical protein